MMKKLTRQVRYTSQGCERQPATPFTRTCAGVPGVQSVYLAEAMALIACLFIRQWCCHEGGAERHSLENTYMRGLLITNGPCLLGSWHRHRHVGLCAPHSSGASTAVPLLSIAMTAALTATAVHDHCSLLVLSFGQQPAVVLVAIQLVG